MDQELKSKLEAAGITSEGFKLLEQYMFDKLAEQHKTISESFEKKQATLREAWTLRKADQIIDARVIKEENARKQALQEKAHEIYTKRCIQEGIKRAIAEEGVDFGHYMRIKRALHNVQTALVESEMSPDARATVKKYRSRISDLHEELDRARREKEALQERYEQEKLQQIFEQVTEDMPMTKRERARSIMETVEFKDFDEFKSILNRVVESVGRVETKPTIEEEPKPQGRMAAYLQYL